jgi:hypothetical protein
MRKFLLLVVMAVFFVGCATSRYSYTLPQIEPKPASDFQKEVNLPFDVAWNKIIGRLSQDLFVINNMDKNSGFINADFSAQQPSQYIDCGLWSGMFKNLSGSATYFHLGADSRNFTAIDGNVAYNGVVKTSLSGKINILLQKVDDKKSNFSVNVKYVLSGIQEAIPFGSMYPYVINWNVDFSSSSMGSVNNGGQTRCVSKGVIEKQILDYL